MRKKNGFTLLEVTVTAAIILILSSISVVQLYKKDINKDLENNRTSVKSALQLARSNATSGYNQSDGINGYGIKMTKNTNSYFLYADKNESYVYDAGDLKVEEYIMDQNLYFLDNYDICFNLIDAVSYSAGSALIDGSSKIIEIKHRDSTTAYKRININGLTSSIN